MMFCPNCGTALEDDSAFCTGCGKPLEKAPEVDVETNAKVEPERTRFVEDDFSFGAAPTPGMPSAGSVSSFHSSEPSASSFGRRTGTMYASVGSQPQAAYVANATGPQPTTPTPPPQRNDRKRTIIIAVAIAAVAIAAIAIIFFVILRPQGADASYNVKFETDGGSIISDVRVDKGGRLTSPETPTKDGYKFAGWYTDTARTQKVTFPFVPKEDTVLYAKWEAQTGTSSSSSKVAQYTVQFDTDGGSAIPATQVDAGGQLAAPSDPVKDGYRFAGWFTDAARTHQAAFPLTPTGNTVLYAKWDKQQPVRYTIQFETDGGSTIPATQVNAGGQLTSPTNPTKSGYEFVGWYTDSALTQRVVFPFAPTGDMVLYAKWKKISSSPTPTRSTTTYNVQFETSGGSTIPAVQVDEGERLTSPADPEKSGKKFAGWYADSALTQQVTFPFTPKGNTVLYAKWEDSRESGLSF